MSNSTDDELRLCTTCGRFVPVAEGSVSGCTSCLALVKQEPESTPADYDAAVALLASPVNGRSRKKRKARSALAAPAPEGMRVRRDSRVVGGGYRSSPVRESTPEAASQEAVMSP